MAKVRHGMAEAVAAVGAVLVASARIYDVLVFLQVLVDVGHERRINLEDRQHGVAVYGVGLYLIGHFQRIGQAFRMVREQFLHLLFRLQILLLGIAQAVGVVQIGIGGEADEAVVHWAVFLAHEVGVVGGDDLDAVLSSQLEDLLRVVALFLVKVVGEAGNLGPVLHHLQVIVFPEYPLVPLDGLFYGGIVVGHNGARNLSRQTGR